MTLQLKIKETIHIQWGKPFIKHQFYHVNLTFHVIAYIVCLHYLFIVCLLFACVVFLVQRPLLYTLNSTL